jgi:hypothetical protein
MMYSVIHHTSKVVSLLFVAAMAFAQPTSIHYSALGNYLVDQDGNKTEIQGHPKMTCYQGLGEIHGTFQKARGATIWLINASRYIEIEKPVCDIKSE